MTNPTPLTLRVNSVLKTEKPVRGPDGRLRWDYEPEHRLAWTDARGVTHFCKMPPVPIPDGYIPITLCQRPIDSLDLRLVDCHELGGTNCPGCFRGDTTRIFAAATNIGHMATPRPTPVRPRLAKPLALVAAGFIAGAVLVGLSEYYVARSGLADAATEPVAEAPVVHPVLHGHESPDEIGNEF